MARINHQSCQGSQQQHARVMCYNGEMTRIQAEEVLRGMPPGAYLVRPCSAGTNKLSLSVAGETQNTVNHYIIRVGNGYRLDGRNDRFCCLKAFLKAHTIYTLGLQTKLTIPIYARSMFHRVEVWEYYNTPSQTWEQLSPENTMQLVSARKSVTSHISLPDGSTINLQTMTLEVPCRYGVISQSLRMRTLYGLCGRCAQRTLHPLVKQQKSNEKCVYTVWEYYDQREWKGFEHGKAFFQHLLSSYHVSCQEGSLFDKTAHVVDNFGTPWYIDLLTNKLVDCGLIRPYKIRQRAVHGVSCYNDKHQERDTTKVQHTIKTSIPKTSHLSYCTESAEIPLTWTNSPTHTLSPSSEEFKSVAMHLPTSRRPYISSIIRVQDEPSWKLFSKEHQVMNLQRKKVKLDLFWAESRLQNSHDTSSKKVLHSSMVESGCYYFNKTVEQSQNLKTLTLCKVVYDSESSSCILDDHLNPNSLHMDSMNSDAIVPLFVVFFSETIRNNAVQGHKDTDKKTVSLDILHTASSAAP